MTVCHPRVRLLAPSVINRVGALATSEAHQVQLDLLVAAPARPDVQRRGGDFVDEGDGRTEAREIDRLRVVPAGLADIDPHVVERWRIVVRKPSLVLLPASRAEDAAERPGRHARGA